MCNTHCVPLKNQTSTKGKPTIQFWTRSNGSKISWLSIVIFTFSISNFIGTTGPCKTSKWEFFFVHVVYSDSSCGHRRTVIGFLNKNNFLLYVNECIKRLLVGESVQTVGNEEKFEWYPNGKTFVIRRPIKDNKDWEVVGKCEYESHCHL